MTKEEVEELQTYFIKACLAKGLFTSTETHGGTLMLCANNRERRTDRPLHIIRILEIGEGIRITQPEGTYVTDRVSYRTNVEFNTGVPYRQESCYGMDLEIVKYLIDKLI